MDNRKKVVATYVVLWIVAVSVTTAVGFLLMPGPRADKFYVSLLALLAAETITAAYPIALTIGKATLRRNLPFHFGTGVIIATYDVGIVLLTLLAMSAISFKLLLSVHLMWALLFLVVLGMQAIGRMHVESLDSRHTSALLPLTTLRTDVTCLRQRLQAMNLDGLEPVKQLVDSLNEDLQYATSDSPDGCETIDAELRSYAAGMSEAIARLEAATREAEKTSVDGHPSGPREAMDALMRNAEAARLCIQRRQELAASLRQNLV